jgi:hypothetical protein
VIQPRTIDAHGIEARRIQSRMVGTPGLGCHYSQA